MYKLEVPGPVAQGYDDLWRGYIGKAGKGYIAMAVLIEILNIEV